jgi:hypothetical protein
VSSNGGLSCPASLSHRLAYWGVAGGFAVGDLLKGDFDLGPARNLVAGAVGGVIGSQIQLLIPALRGFDINPNPRPGDRSCHQWDCFEGRGRRCHTPASAPITNALTKNPKTINQSADNDCAKECPIRHNKPRAYIQLAGNDAEYSTSCVSSLAAEI